MQPQMLEVKRERFHLLEDDLYILQGNWPKNHELLAFLDKDRVESTMEDWESSSAVERFQEESLLGEKKNVYIRLPKKLDSYKRLYIYAVAGSEKLTWFEISTKALKKKQGKPQFFLEEETVNTKEQTLRLRGWAVDKDPVDVSLYDKEKQKLPCLIQRNTRYDVAAIYPECKVESKSGFYIEMNQLPEKVVYLVLASRGRKAVYPVSLQRPIILKNKVEKYVRKGMDYYRAHGFYALTAKALRKMHTWKDQSVDYQKWMEKHLPSEGELEQQRGAALEINPKFSIVVPLYKTPIPYLRQMIQSVKEQTYGNWELCLSDGSGASSPLTKILEEYEKEDARIRILKSPTALQISENTNAAIEAATGDFIAFMDHDDMLTPNALFECAKLLCREKETEIIYSDEDKMSMDGNKYFQPHMKPDFNLDLLCTVNYICHLFVVKKEIIERVGMLRKEFDGAQDYDFILRCVEASGNIRHIPKVLYHWRSHEDSTAENPESKMYAFDAGQRAVQAHYERIGVQAEVFKGEYLGLYRTKFIRAYDPLISILIPNKDHTDDLERCISSIETKSTYHNYEYIIIENNSTEEKTFAYYKALEEKNPKVKVVYYKGGFNYSAINNFGARYAKGEYLLLLNNDTEIINEDCLEELLGYCTREDVGIVGARMYYEDDTIQHAGVVIGFGGIAGHCFVQQPRGFTGYCHRIICAQDYSAVTAACMLVKKSVFDAVGGLTEELAVAFNDIDFCLKVRDLGKLVVYNPYAELYHYESKSRGLEDTPEKVARFQKEIAIMERRWPKILKEGDPYYNPNLALDRQDFSLKRI